MPELHESLKSDDFYIRCNHCDWVGYDEDLTLYETAGDKSETITAEETRLTVTRYAPQTANPDFFKGCPNCKTDGYLMDVEQPISEIK